jgi:hypothetical protein
MSSRRAGLLFAALGFAGLFGFDTRGCGGPSPVPPVSTTGGGSGTTGSSGVDGGSCRPGCSTLDESACGMRTDCRAVYDETGCSKTFERCEAVACPVINWMAPTGCIPKHDANGCVIPQCEETTCHSNADCGPGYACEGLGACPVGMPTCDQVQPGTEPPCCETRSICVLVGRGCNSDAECGPGQRCENGALTGPGECVDVRDGGSSSSDAGFGWSDGGVIVDGDGGAPSNCGSLVCASGDVCVHTTGGVMTMDGGGGSWFSCEPFPASCSTVASCDCVGRAICGGATTCSASGIEVTCYAP